MPEPTSTAVDTIPVVFLAVPALTTFGIPLACVQTC